MASVIAPSSPADPAAASDPTGPVAAPADETALALARQVAEQEAGAADRVGEFLGTRPEDEIARTLSFAALDPGYRGWRWSVTLAQVGQDAPTVSEVLLLPGSDALVPPPWLPWAERVRGQDVGPGDLHPVGPDDERLVPGYLQSDDPAVQDVALEVGLGRRRVLGVLGRLDAADRWHAGEFGPQTPMAEQAPASCVSCGFYVPLAGALGVALGACANEFSPADGRVVDAAFGCGAHSETEIDMPMLSAAADMALDDGVLDVFPRHADEVVAEPVDGGEPGTGTGDAGVDAPADLAAGALFDVEPADVEPADVEPADVEAADMDPADVDPAVDDATGEPGTDPVDTTEVRVDGPVEVSESEPTAEDASIVAEDTVPAEAGEGPGEARHVDDGAGEPPAGAGSVLDGPDGQAEESGDIATEPLFGLEPQDVVEASPADPVPADGTTGGAGDGAADDDQR